MTKTEVRQMLRERLGAAVAAEGFRARRDVFVRPIPGGCQSLAVALWDHAPRFEFSVSMGIRLEEVEDLVNPFAGTEAKYRAETLTSLTQLEFLGLTSTPGLGVRFGGDDDASLTRAAQALTEVVTERVLPFFERYHDLRTVEAGLNPPGSEELRTPRLRSDRSRFDDSNEPYRAMRGIATAYLVGQDNLPALIEAYRGQLSQMVPEIRSKFEALAEFLLANPRP